MERAKRSVTQVIAPDVFEALSGPTEVCIFRSLSHCLQGLLRVFRGILRVFERVSTALCHTVSSIPAASVCAERFVSSILCVA